MDSLPTLTSSPLRHPSSCASLSIPLLELLNAILPTPPALTLSVGSGPGLLEALFLERHPHRTNSFLGVEVRVTHPRTVNRFLPDLNVVVVPGTWAIAPEAARAEALLFVYPRQPGLISVYLERAKEVRTVVWIGSRCDVRDFVSVLREWGEESVTASEGLVEEGEVVMVFLHVKYLTKT
ncbi:hypothetical protein FB45DRAFT_834981 [Roridomyces roridus]|uniref:Uncharacterized protein n=1 Tax=Roridomyces roridus TaxID=1738132 RepID=A0AAD7BS28_9AGAR|nr:hypothetical protein FB45DRAFT_834981 [Roridomyces roridus]